MDGSVLGLVRQFLQSGVMTGDGWEEVEEVEEGSPQGGVSPLLANIYLDASDQEMKSRGHRIVRYADDILNSNDYPRELGLFDLGGVRTAATASSKRG